MELSVCNRFVLPSRVFTCAKRAPCRVLRSWSRQRALSSADNAELSRSSLLRTAPLLFTLFGGAITPTPASAEVVADLARQFLRPDVEVEKAVVILLDAKSTLKDLAALAATPADSEERFRSRRVLPAFAQYLRPVGEAAPVVAQLVTRSSSKEATLGALYGGEVTEGTAVTDEVYQAIGRVLTISGRTIRIEAQADPDRALAAITAIDNLLNKVPASTVQAAQQIRIARAQKN